MKSLYINCFTRRSMRGDAPNILRENIAFKASPFLKLRVYEVPQNTKVQLSCDGTGLHSICSYLFKKHISMVKVAMKPHHVVTFPWVKGCYWLKWEFSPAGIWQLWVLPCPLGKKWASSFTKYQSFIYGYPRKKLKLKTFTKFWIPLLQ